MFHKFDYVVQSFLIDAVSLLITYPLYSSVTIQIFNRWFGTVNSFLSRNYISQEYVIFDETKYARNLITLTPNIFGIFFVPKFYE